MKFLFLFCLPRLWDRCVGYRSRVGCAVGRRVYIHNESNETGFGNISRVLCFYTMFICTSSK